MPSEGGTRQKATLLPLYRPPPTCAASLLGVDCHGLFCQWPSVLYVRSEVGNNIRAAPYSLFAHVRAQHPLRYALFFGFLR